MILVWEKKLPFHTQQGNCIKYGKIEDGQPQSPSDKQNAQQAYHWASRRSLINGARVMLIRPVAPSSFGGWDPRPRRPSASTNSPCSVDLVHQNRMAKRGYQCHLGAPNRLDLALKLALLARLNRPSLTSTCLRQRQTCMKAKTIRSESAMPISWCHSAYSTLAGVL